MKRFYKEVSVDEVDGGWRVLLDGRAIKTQAAKGGNAQIVPTQALAELLAEEWRAQGEEIDTAGFPLRDMADHAIEIVRPDRAAAITSMLRFAETDTLCYRADPDEPVFKQQTELWEPLVAACEQAHGIRLERVSGVIARPQPPETLEKLHKVLDTQDDFTLAAINMMASLAASMVIALAALEDGADAEVLFAAANFEEDWQAEQWGWDEEAEKLRAKKLEAFETAARFLGAARA